MPKMCLGLTIGDIILTEYGSGPFEITSFGKPGYLYDHGSAIVVRSWIEVSLRCSAALGHRLYGKTNSAFYLSARRDPDGRWFNDSNDELYLLSYGDRPFQPSLFDGVEQPAAWEFDPDVDYTREVWHCDRHGDYNTEPRRGIVGDCPVCGRSWMQIQIIIMSPRDRSRQQYGAYWVATHGKDKPLGPPHYTAGHHACDKNRERVIAILKEHHYAGPLPVAKMIKEGS